MRSITVYNVDTQGWYLGTSSVAYESPLEPGQYLVPADAVEAEPPTDIPDGLWPRWDGTSWQLETMPEVNLKVDKSAEVRARRNALLAETDWVFVTDRPTDKDHPKWVADMKRYRQALRDITASPDFPENVVWPEKPL